MEESEKPFMYLVAGGVGGICTVVAGHPLDTIKVCLQTMPIPNPGQTPIYIGAFDCAMTVVQNDGISALYNDMAAPVTAVTLMTSLVFLRLELERDCNQQNTTVS